MNKREIGFLFILYYIIDIFVKDLNRYKVLTQYNIM